MTASAPFPSHRYVLLDRDGTINVDTHYLSDPDELRLETDAVAGLCLLRDMGFRFAVLTNQSGIARGYFTRARLEEIHDRLTALLAEQGITLDGYFICPHGPDEDCPCRKPLPGLGEQARQALGFDPRQAWMIGDKDADIGLGQALGAKTVLVRTGKGAKTEAAGTCTPTLIADTLADAARQIAAYEQA
ncbi:D-glycero-beta-D-manno-heptose 1,7-bisphosphate 7-phosphatase [Novispirillum itersonii]|uniref:D,D-heptose 1,7-bisphosphate phosphatase n=1 Tax=Novispirillum itersonii TaxID=189 RepID=A0A7X0DLD1_NOVIT|nr:D-glycero-beta-D-manno-heptose 1,7-bisphosphate 7-phosphatase [Novispirillum itersonii]MBB6209865.1 D-glycero-D-manno-heptose 1,7-bisphosphate phosphatase [Novispirillum itersonii]